MEGGGALLRTAIQLSCLTQMPFELSQIRGATPFPGLDNEDIQILSGLAQATSAHVEGATLGSSTLFFAPARRAKALQTYLTDAEGASRKANTLVVLSTLAPILARSFAYSSVEVQGETYGNASLSYDYFTSVVQRAWSKMGLYCYPKLIAAGFNRDSDGVVAMDIEPSAIEPIDWSQRGSLRSAKAILTLCELPKLVTTRGVSHLNGLAKSAGIELEIETLSPGSSKPGAFVTFAAEFERGLGGAVSMGSRGLRVEALVQGGFDQFMQVLRAPEAVDPHLADHLVIPCVLANGPSHFTVSRLTRRFLTTVWVVKQFLPIHLTIKGKEDGPGEVSIRQE